MVSKELNTLSCPPDLQIIEILATKWAVFVLQTLSHRGTLRSGTLYKALNGVSHKVFTQVIRRLERDGFVERKVYAKVPPEVEYSLTPLGESMIRLLETVCHWATKHYPQVEIARRTYDQSNTSA